MPLESDVNFRGIMSLEELNCPALLELARRFESGGQVAAAIKTYQRARIVDPLSEEGHLHLSRLWFTIDPTISAIIAESGLQHTGSMALRAQATRAWLAAGRADRAKRLKPVRTRRGSSSFSGTFGVFPLPDMLEFFSMQRLSGVLSIVGGKEQQTARLWLAQGNLLAIESPGFLFPPELGHPATHAADLTAIIVDDETVRRRIHRQVIEQLSALVEWTEGRFDFVAESREIHASWAVDTRLALFDAMRRFDERMRKRE